MTIKLGLKGGGGIFRAETFVHSQTIASGQTGDLVTIGTTGKITKLTFFVTNDNAIPQPDITITSDGQNIISGEGISDYTPALNTGVFIAMSSTNSTDVRAEAANLSDVVGEFITISKGVGNTIEPLLYSYETGVIS